MTPSRKNAAVCLEQTIASRMEEAELLCLKIRELLQSNCLARFRFPVEILARESLANAVNHGNGNGAANSIVLQLRNGRSWLRLQVTDNGPGFAWRKAIQKDADVKEPCGRGLRLYATYAERFRFNPCGNRITLWVDKKKLPRNGE